MAKTKTMLGLGYFKRAINQHMERAERCNDWQAVDAYTDVLRLVDEHLVEE